MKAVDIPVAIEVVRWREGDQLVWQLGPIMTTWMERIDR